MMQIPLEQRKTVKEGDIVRNQSCGKCIAIDVQNDRSFKLQYISGFWAGETAFGRYVLTAGGVQNVHGI